MKKLFFLLFLIPFSIFPSSPAFAQTFPSPVTATITIHGTVGLSDLWASEIAKNSEVEVQKPQLNYFLKSISSFLPISKNQELEFDTVSRGLNNQIMSNQNIEMEIAKDSKLVEKVSQTADKQGKTSFVFTPQDSGQYLFYFTNTTYDKKVRLNKEINLIIN